MNRREVRLATAACFLLSSTSAFAQRGGNDWMTSGFDAQRSHWVRNDAKISPESMRKPGFELVWKLDLAKTPRQLNSITTPALIDFYIGYRGFRTLAFLSTSTDKAIGIDTDLGRVEWEKDFAASAPAGTTSLGCPGGITSAVTRPVNIAYPPPPIGRGTGRGNPAKSGVGEPFQGAVTLKPPASLTVAPTAPPKPAPAKAAAPNPFAPRVQYVHVLTGDGKFHSLFISNGEEPKPVASFLPPNANAQGLVVFDNNAYVTTANSCGGAANGVWALNLESQKVSQWKATGNIAGTAGPAVGPDGTLYAASDSGELVALEPGALKVKNTYKGAKFSSSPVVFEFKGKDLVAIASGDGSIHLHDTANLGTPLAKTPAFSSANFETGSLASWLDPVSATRWILAPAGGSSATGAGFTAANGTVKNGAVVAWKVVEDGGKIALQPGWVSRDMTSPLTPIVIGGTVFAVSSGEFRTNDAKMSASERAKRSSAAVLYALDPNTGKELWSSGNTMKSFVHNGGLSAGGTRVYVSTYDGTQYAFGFPIEH